MSSADKFEQRLRIATWVVGLAVAVVLLVFYGWMLWRAYIDSQDGAIEEKAWAQMSVVLTSVAAIVLPAVGFLFGTQAGAKQAAEANQRADEEAANASNSNAAAVELNTKLSTLNGMILDTGTNGSLQAEAGNDGNKSAAELARLRNFVESQSRRG